MSGVKGGDAREDGKLEQETAVHAKPARAARPCRVRPKMKREPPLPTAGAALFRSAKGAVRRLEESGNCDKAQGNEKGLRHPFRVLPQLIGYDVQVVNIEDREANDHGDDNADKP